MAPVLDPSPQTRYPRKGKKQGGGGTSATTKSSGVIPGSRYRFTSQDVTGKVIFYFSSSSIYVLRTYQVVINPENSNH